MKKVDYIFIVSNQNQKPFHKLNYLNDNYMKIILPYFLKNNTNSQNQNNLISINEKIINKTRFKKLNFLEVINFLLFHYKQFTFVFNFIRRNKSKINHNPKILSKGFKNFLVSYFVKFYLGNAVLISHPGDEINKNYKYFGNDFLSQIANFLFIKFQIFLKKLTIRKSWVLYMEKGLYNYDKKEYKLPINKKIFLNSLIDTKKFKKFKKTKIYNNIVFFGNIQNDGHIENLSKINQILREKYNKIFKIHVIGHDPERIIKKLSNPDIIHYGYLKKFSYIEKIFRKCSFGSALYDFKVKKKKIILSGKINDYFSHCIPVIASNNAYEKKIITKKKLGFCSNNLYKIAEFINYYSSNKKKYLEIIKNLENYSKNCDESINLNYFYDHIKKI